MLPRLNEKKKVGRKSLPSCVVNKVRTLYPDPNENYTGFQASQKSPVLISKRNLISGLQSEKKKKKEGND